MDTTLPSFIWGLLVLQLFKTGATLLLYGFHVNLFILAVFTLYRRKTSGRTWLLAASWMLFLLGTLHTALRLSILSILVRMVSLLIGRNDDSPTAMASLLQRRATLELADNAIFAFNVLVTDSVLLYRCYLIWGYQWKPIVLPGVLILLTSATGASSLIVASQSRNYIILGGKVEVITAVIAYSLALATNVALMALTAGRIWWMRRELSHFKDVVHKTLDTRYNTAISIILESGSIYCFCAMLLVIALSVSGSSSNFYSATLGIAYQAVNIAPTLTVVRVGLGYNIEDSIKTGLANSASNDNFPRPILIHHFPSASEAIIGSEDGGQKLAI